MSAVCIRCDKSTTLYIVWDGWVTCARCVAEEDRT